MREEDLQKNKMNNTYTQFSKKMKELFARKNKLINEFKHRLEARKITNLKDQIINR